MYGLKCKTNYGYNILIPLQVFYFTKATTMLIRTVFMICGLFFANLFKGIYDNNYLLAFNRQNLKWIL
jgi:hypothetical protein